MSRGGHGLTSPSSAPITSDDAASAPHPNAAVMTAETVPVPAQLELAEKVRRKLGQLRHLHELARQRSAAHPRNGILEGSGPEVLDEHCRQRGAAAAAQGTAEVAQHLGHAVAWCPRLQSSLGCLPSRGRVNPEIEQLCNEAAGTALEVDRHRISGGLVGCHEQHVQDSHNTAALEPLERPDQLAFERGVRVEPEYKPQLPRGQLHLSGHHPSMTAGPITRLIRIGGCGVARRLTEFHTPRFATMRPARTASSSAASSRSFRYA